MRFLEILGGVPSPVLHAAANAALWVGGGIVYLTLVVWP